MPYSYTKQSLRKIKVFQNYVTIEKCIICRMLKYQSSSIIEETTSLTNNPITVYQSPNNEIFLQRVD